jgi:hypothetical protein
MATDDSKKKLQLSQNIDMFEIVISAPGVHIDDTSHHQVLQAIDTLQLTGSTPTGAIETLTGPARLSDTCSDANEIVVSDTVDTQSAATTATATAAAAARQQQKAKTSQYIRATTTESDELHCHSVSGQARGPPGTGSISYVHTSRPTSFPRLSQSHSQQPSPSNIAIPMTSSSSSSVQHTTVMQKSAEDKSSTATNVAAAVDLLELPPREVLPADLEREDSFWTLDNSSESEPDSPSESSILSHSDSGNDDDCFL